MLGIHAAAVFVQLGEAAAAEVAVPADCGSGAEFEREVERRLGQPSPLRPLSVDIHAERGGYALRMQVGGEQRELHDSDCRALFRAAVVITAAVTLSETRERRSEPRPATSEPVAAPAPTASSEPARAPRELEVALALEGGLNFGLLPEAARELGLFAKVRHRHFGLSLSSRYLGPADQQDASGRGVQIQGVNGELGALYRAGVLELSAAATAALLFGSGYGPGRQADSAWAAGPAASITLLPYDNSWMWVGVGGTLYWNVMAPDFEFLPYGPIFSSSTISGSLFLRIGPRFR